VNYFDFLQDTHHSHKVANSTHISGYEVVGTHLSLRMIPFQSFLLYTRHSPNKRYSHLSVTVKCRAAIASLKIKIAVKMAVFWDVAPYSLVDINQCFRGAYCFHHQDDESLLMMEAVRSFETLVIIYQTTWCNIPEDCHLHSLCHENLKSHEDYCVPTS
jgi:hypothetical protein